MSDRQYKFRFEGKDYYANAPVLAPSELEKIIGAAHTSNSRLIVVRGSSATPVSGSVNLQDTPQIERIPRGTHKGQINNISLNQRATYIKAQVASIAEVYGARYGVPIQLTRNLDYLFLPRFPLPRRWGERETPILICLPQDYPNHPPHGFWLSQKCLGPHIYSRDVYNEIENVHDRGWNWYCCHCDDGWQPGPTPLEPCNLWTVLNVIKTTLTIDEF